jgi:hypothetical protein
MTARCPNFVAIGLALLVCVSISGCGGTYDASVSGAVTLDGNAVPRGTVAYIPAGGGPAAYSPIQENGSYSLRTGRESGLPPGEYLVTVTSNEVPAQFESKDGRPMPPGKAITPLWYRSKDTSGLKYSVVSGANEINLELTSQPPAGWKSR